MNLDKIKDNKIRWYGHIKRMNTGRIPREALEYWLGEMRPRYRPRYKWEEQVKKNVEKIKIIGVI